MSYERPDIKTIPDGLDKKLSAIALLLLILNLGFTVWMYIISPDIIPGHFDFSGKVNRYDNKETIFILPAVMIFVYALLSVVIRYPNIHNYPTKITPENAEGLYRRSIRMLRMLLIGIMVLFSVILFEMYLGIKKNYLPLHWWGLPLVLLLTLGLPIYLSFKMFPVTKTDQS